ncbi:ABC transporter permease [Nocardioides jishulii]|uniref:ABC transporter permease n=1 Tax=Nocardioides jishulii TaxID=2575440 RepID=A0A4U2YQ19_9ACTN|nr:ABC transporter permease [Nocardioides jishulii]QCX27926.1 ABC transporter permease [Nocardioides jishulii]TKI62732.1 ABC transporter permease [Nocardioides jishulii]
MTLAPVKGATVRTPRRVSTPWRLVLGRLGFLVAALFGVMTLSFLLVSVTPGDPARLIAGPLASDSQVEAIEAELGLDRPLGERYVDYVAGLVKGDLGTSYYSKQPIVDEIASKLPATLSLVLLAVLLAAVLGVVVGSLGAYFRGRWPDSVGRLFTGIFQAVPDFFLGLILIYLLFFVAGIAPAPAGQLAFSESPPPKVTGAIPIDALVAGDTALFVSSLQHLVLPVLTLALVYAAYFAKTARTTVGRALNSQQVHFARAMGLRERTVLRYAFVESRTTIVTYAGVIFAALLGGEAIVEKVFAWDGIGTWALNGILRLDLPVVQGMVLVAGALTLITYTLLDIVVGLLDPRIKHA